MRRPSYLAIDYSLRPAKHAERKMIVEALAKLSAFSNLDKYQYVGFGSVWFTDFSLFHRNLNIKKMISIERQVQHSARFEFNKPFAGIEMRYGTATVELPKLDWSPPTITWLDYDWQLSPEIVEDVRLVARKAISGNCLIVTVSANTTPVKSINDDGEIDYVETPADFIGVFGQGGAPADLSTRNLRGDKNLSELYRKVLLSNIEDVLAAENQTKSFPLKLHFKVISHLNYKDGVLMTTLMGLFVKQGDLVKFEDCDFESLVFFSDRVSEPVDIRMPLLTPKEMRHIERSLPPVSGRTVDAASCPKDQAEIFVKYYRYLPSFAPYEP